MNVTSLRDLQTRIESTRAERGFATDPVRVLCLLVEEVGEVASEIKKTWSANYPELEVDKHADEIADAFVLLSALASTFDVDLETAVERKFLVADATREWASSTRDPGASASPGS